MIELKMDETAKKLHRSFFQKEFKIEFLYILMKNNQEFNFHEDISVDLKSYLVEAREEYNSKISNNSPESDKRETCKRLEIKKVFFENTEMKNLISLSNALLDESDYSELINKENLFGSYIIELSKKIFSCEIIYSSYTEYKENKNERGWEKNKLVYEFENSFKERLYKDRMCRTISVKKFKNIENKENISSTDWCAYMYTSLLDVSVCPYCNSQYIYTYQNEVQGRMRAELDHCLPKKHHPFLAVSIYNLVPSCSQCNGSLKGDKDIGLDEVMNLFTEKITDKYRFYIHSEKDLTGFIGNSLNYDIKIYFDENFNDKKRLMFFLRSFHIENRYNFFKKYLNEQIYYQVNHTKSYNEFLENLLYDLEEVNFPKVETRKYAEERNENRILGKLNNDILTSEHLTTLSYKDFFTEG